MVFRVLGFWFGMFPLVLNRDDSKGHVRSSPLRTVSIVGNSPISNQYQRKLPYGPPSFF